MTDSTAEPAAATRAEPGQERPHPGGDQHAVCLDGTAADLTHPATCPGPDTCPFTAAAATATPVMLAVGGTWTTGINNGSLILLRQITAPA
jgi:hypothetical protein